jgi:branched-chain amino acid aminotransferase
MTNPLPAPDRTIWRNGEFVAWEDATVHVLAQSLQRGTLAFDYMSVHETARGPAILRLNEHIERLIRTCELAGLPLDYSREKLIEACAETVRHNPGAKSVKISALIASVEVELIPQDPTISVFIAAYDSATDIIARHENPFPMARHVALKIERTISNRRHDIIAPQMKLAANYTSPMMAKWRARHEGFDDVLLLTEQGHVAEAPTSNLFIVNAAGELLTPPADEVLLGITRASVIELATALGIPCREQALTVDDVFTASEAFLTATSVGVWPIVRVDDVTLSEGKPGPISNQLREKLRRISKGEEPGFEHWLHYV